MPGLGLSASGAAGALVTLVSIPECFLFVGIAYKCVDTVYMGLL